MVERLGNFEIDKDAGIVVLAVDPPIVLVSPEKYGDFSVEITKLFTYSYGHGGRDVKRQLNDILKDD